MSDKTKKTLRPPSDRDALVHAFTTDPALVGEPFWVSLLRELDPEQAARLGPGEYPDLETMKRIIHERARRNREDGNKNQLLAVKVSPTMMDQVDEAAEAAGMSRPEWVRHVIANALDARADRRVEDYIAQHRAELEAARAARDDDERGAR